jgi:hypothetical protein
LSCAEAVCSSLLAGCHLGAACQVVCDLLVKPDEWQHLLL